MNYLRQQIDKRVSADQQRQLLRALMNVRMPVSENNADFLQIQDEYLKEEAKKKGIIDAADLVPVQPGLYVWQGDITTLRCDDTFVQDKGWYQAADRYEDFLRCHEELKVVFLELGVGNNTLISASMPDRHTPQGR